MPNRKRSPIEYKAQFGEGVFRPREVVEAELAGASAEGKDNIGSIPPVEVPRGKRPVTGRTNGRTANEPSFDTPLISARISCSLSRNCRRGGLARPGRSRR